MSFDLDAWSQRWLPPLDTFLRTRVADTWPASFAEPLAYPLFTGGKRIRPALAVAAWQAIAPDPDELGMVLPAAAAVELIHTYSLVHDDLPAMDDDDERRGRPTVHKAFDEPTAILVGDALLTEAFAVLAEAPWFPATRAELVSTLSRAAGWRGMVGGQVADIRGAVDDLDTLTRLHRMKTGALIRWSTVSGATIAGADPSTQRALADYGDAVGLAFQLADDVLDAEEDAGESGPPTFVRLLGVDGTRAKAEELAERAIDTVSGLPRPDALITLARFTVQRDR